MKNKTVLIAAVAAAIVMGSYSLPANAAEAAKKPANTYASYTCEDLTSLQFEKVGPMVYYVAGHYDAKHDIWTDYGPNSKSETADMLTVRLPVEDIYVYCSKNPKDTVVNAIAKTAKK